MDFWREKKNSKSMVLKSARINTFFEVECKKIPKSTFDNIKNEINVNLTMYLWT